jgi:hypothetical protein
MNAIAKPVVKNKYWIVEEGGIKVGTIQAVDQGGVTYVHGEEREQFTNIKMLSKKYNIVFSKSEKQSKDKVSDVYGYPCTSKTFNEIFDVQRKLPIYTKTAHSKSYFCAGHYLVKYNQSWVHEYCPKLITLNRYDYRGPFKTEEETRYG